MSNALTELLANVLASNGVSVEDLLSQATHANVLAQAEPETQEVINMGTHIVVKGTVVPFITDAKQVTKEVKKAYNSALTKSGLPTLGGGGGTVENLQARYLELANNTDSPGQAKQNQGAATGASLEQALTRLLSGQATVKQVTEGTGTLREVIRNYTPKAKTRVWAKADGTKVQVTEAQYQHYVKLRELAKERAAARTVVEPVLPAGINTDALVQALLPALMQALAGK